MKSRTLPACLARSALLLGLGLPASALAVPIIVDGFDSPGGGGHIVSVVNPPAGFTFSDRASGLPVLGGSREIGVEVLAVTAPAAGIEAWVNKWNLGAYQLASSVHVTPRAWLTYDADGAGLNSNLSGQLGFGLYGAENDQLTTYEIELKTFGGGSSTAALSTPAGFTGDVLFPWGLFSSGANLADVDSIRLTITAAKGGDVAIARFLAPGGTTHDIPDPASSLALLSLAGLGLGMLSRSRPLA